jgi:hypothetical protein
VDHYFPVRLNESIGRLAFGRSGNNLWLVIDKIFTDGHPKKFRIAITVEAARKRTGGSTEKSKSRKNAGGRTSFQTEGPIATGGTIHEDEGKTGTPHGNTITESNVHVDGVKVTVICPIEGLTSFSLWYSGIRAKRHREFTAIHPLAISADFKNVFVIPEFPTSHDTMDLLRRPMNFCVRSIGTIAWTDIQKRRVGMVEKPSDLIWGHSREKDRRFGSGDRSQMRR